MKYIFTSDFHEPGSAKCVIDHIFSKYDPFEVRFIHLGDFAVQKKNGPFENAVRAAQKKAAGDKELESRLKKEAKKRLLEENLEGVLEEVIFNDSGTLQNILAIKAAYELGTIKEPFIDTGGNYDPNMAKNVEMVLKHVGAHLAEAHVEAGTTLSCLGIMQNNPAFELLNDVKVIYDRSTAIVLVPYNLDETAWKGYMRMFEVISKECARRRTRTVVVGSHERVGAKRKAYMQPILDEAIVMFGNQGMRVYSVGGHIHEQEAPRSYNAVTENGTSLATVLSTGLGDGLLRWPEHGSSYRGIYQFCQIFDSRAGIFSENSELAVRLDEPCSEHYTNDLRRTVEMEVRKWLQYVHNKGG